MSTVVEKTPRGSSNTRSIIAIGGCVLGLGLIFLGLKLTSPAEEEESAERKIVAAKTQKRAPVWKGE
jgi:Na+/phosphate symporter